MARIKDQILRDQELAPEDRVFKTESYVDEQFEKNMKALGSSPLAKAVAKMLE